jgi:hypothetical protein
VTLPLRQGHARVRLHPHLTPHASRRPYTVVKYHQTTIISPQTTTVVDCVFSTDTVYVSSIKTQFYDHVFDQNLKDQITALAKKPDRETGSTRGARRENYLVAGTLTLVRSHSPFHVTCFIIRLICPVIQQFVLVLQR